MSTVTVTPAAITAAAATPAATIDSLKNDPGVLHSQHARTFYMLLDYLLK
jgi:hypothetical protein